MPFIPIYTNPWYRPPPVIPPNVVLFKPFIHEWNMGLHGKIKRKRNLSHITNKEGKASAKVDANAPSHNDKARTEIDVTAQINKQEGKASAKIDANAP